VIEAKIIALLEALRPRALDRREIATQLNLRGGERKQLTRILLQLEKSGQIQQKRGRYRLVPRPEPERDLEGIFSLAAQGYGFVRFDDNQTEDLFIPARHVDTAMDGDRVRVRLRASARDSRPYGRIVEILHRAHQRLIGSYRLRGQRAEVWPLDKKLGAAVQVGLGAKINPGDLVEVEIEDFPHGEFAARGRISEVLGAANDPQVDIETVIRQQDLPHKFSSAALREAELLAQEVDPQEVSKRVDLRELSLVTIDGETAKDFDDAVALRKDADNYRLWVCIADVSQYVTIGSSLDQDARERGTSVYFPGFCLPMLPEALSNGICSLNPQQDRLVMAAELLFDPTGRPLETKFYPAVMCSRARLTYTQVAEALDHPQQTELDSELVAQLQAMNELAQSLTAMRQARGSLDLDIPEVEVLLDEQGKPVGLHKAERNQAHRLIEEFMLAANEAVARFLTNKHWPLLYRIHAAPDPLKLQELQQLAAECGLGLVLGKQPQFALQQLLVDAAERPEARLINQQLLRSLQQACYTPENQGHFGLAADHYCHFTSPIRRYPDLVVHRILKLALTGQAKSAGYSFAELESLGQECSTKERRAMQAERDLVELRRCQIMAGKIGVEAEGVISSVAEFGFFVELDEMFVEGLVPLRSLTDDFYHFDPTTLSLLGQRRRRRFCIGMRVRVRVKQVELWRRRIDFELLEVAENVR